MAKVQYAMIMVIAQQFSLCLLLTAGLFVSSLLAEAHQVPLIYLEADNQGSNAIPIGLAI